jgi:hypothetical protein
MSVDPQNPPETSRFQYYMQTVKETFSTAKTALSQRVNTMREKMPTYQATVQNQADRVWNSLSPSSQRYVQLVYKRDAAQVAAMEVPYEKNLLEEVGDWMLYPMVDLPYKLSSVQNSPIAVGTAATVGGLFSLRFIAHPIKTAAMVGRKIAFLPRLSYYFAQVGIIGLGFRSIGRLTNTSLMERFHAPAKPVKENQD